MPPLQRILAEALARVKPSPAEKKETLAKVNKFLSDLNRRLKKQGCAAKADLGGSFAKDTWLRGDYDVDVFVRFGPKHRNDDLSALLAGALAQHKPQRIHGSRDYFWVRNGINFEIVPVLAIKRSSEAKNVTDFSPLHVAWVNTQGRKLKEDILLLKQFCKAHGVYGAESYIRGFSGHVVDILTITHKGFLPLLRKASSWKPKVVIDAKNVYKGKALLALNASKTVGPLVLVDPVQPSRNAAAALEEDKFIKFTAAAKGFLRKPSAEHFVEKEPDLAALGRKGALVTVEAAPLDGKDDVVGTKLYKAFERLRDALMPFGIVTADWRWKRGRPALLWFVLKQERLPATHEVQGPPASMEKHAAAFRKAHRRVTVRKGRLFATVAREHPEARDALRAALRDPDLKDKASSWRIR